MEEIRRKWKSSRSVGNKERQRPRPGMMMDALHSVSIAIAKEMNESVTEMRWRDSASRETKGESDSPKIFLCRRFESFLSRSLE